LSPAEELADTQRTRSSGQTGATSERDQEEARTTLEQTLGALDTIWSEAHDHDPRRVEAEAHLSSFGSRQQLKDAAASAAAEPTADTDSVHDAIETQLARIRAEDNDSSEDDALAVRPPRAVRGTLCCKALSAAARRPACPSALTSECRASHPTSFISMKCLFVSNLQESNLVGGVRRTS